MNKEIKYILFDAANTLIHKPLLWDKLIEVFYKHGYIISKTELKKRHKILSEIIHFPDKTSKTFYSDFNSELCRLLGIVPLSNLVDDIFDCCKYLPWESFNDVVFLENIKHPMGVLSNFNSGLEELLKIKLPNVKFNDFIVSELEGVSKPNVDFYNKAIEKINIEPSSILYIGDSLKLDIEPALSLGFQVKLIDRDSTYKDSPYYLNSLNNL